MGTQEGELERREAELMQARVPHMGQHHVSWTLVVGLVCAGLVLCLAIAWTAAGMPRKRPRGQEEPSVDKALLTQAIEAYGRKDWAEAERAFLALRAIEPQHARVRDYLERIELTRRDAERLTQAEGALVAGDAERARLLASTVGPNSDLFAQAESVARSAQEQLARPVAAALPGGGRPSEQSLDVKVALGEALALYELGSFEEAALRAEVLAQQASGGARQDLLSWAHDVRSFAQRVRALPADAPGLVGHVSEAREVVELDERLGHGHYARALRERVADALIAASTRLLASGDAFGGCARVRDARSFRVPEQRLDPLEKRCEAEAARRHSQARALERQRPDEARRLYRQVLTLSARGSGAFRSAQKALAQLDSARSRAAW